MEGCGNIQREGVERIIPLDRELINVQAGGTSDFNELENRPSYNGEQMTGNTNIPEVPTAVSQLTNDSGYQTGDQVESTVQQAVGAVTDDLADEITAREQADTALNTAIGDETTARQLADTNLQGQIDAITASSDVKDIVGTKAELNNYDTSTLGNNDIIKVLQDESENNATTYYRWSTTTEQFTLIGEEGPYYTKSQADALLNAKQNTLTAGTGITITNDVISADGGGLTTLSYGHSTWQDFITAYNASKIVYCRASSSSDPGSGSQTRMAFMAYINNPTNPTEVEFQYVRSVSSKTATNQTDQVFVYKLTSANGGTWTVETRNMAANVAAGTNAERTYASGVITINPRLYTTTGQNTDGGITQKLFTDTVGNIETDMAGKQNTLTAGTGIDITNDVISATGGGGPNVVQTTGNSTTDVMSQNATTGMVYENTTNKKYIRLDGQFLSTPYSGGVAIGGRADNDCIAIGYNNNGYGARAIANSMAIGQNSVAGATGKNYALAIGGNANATGAGSIAIGRFAKATEQGQMDIGVSNAGWASSTGYDGSQYRLLTGLYDPQNAHDAANKQYVDAAIAALEARIAALEGN